MLIVLLCAFLTACSSSNGDEQPPSTGGQDPSADREPIASDNAGTVDDETEPPIQDEADPATDPVATRTRNLLSPAFVWTTWSGADSAITYDPVTDSLLIPAAPSDDSDTYGVQRYRMPLPANQEFVLAVSVLDGTSPVIATLFVYGADDQPLDVTNIGNNSVAQYHTAKPGIPVRFIAPAGVSGLAVQLSSVARTRSSRVALSLVALDGEPDVVHSDFRPAGYDTLVLADEFDQTQLNRDLWCTRLAYGGGPPLQIADSYCTRFAYTGVADYSNFGENQRFRDFNRQGQPLHQVSDGSLKLHATATGANEAQRYEAAAIRSKLAFKPNPTTSYYVTARVRLPNVLGIWPALYLIPGLGTNGVAHWPPEIDIFEGAINGGAGENAFTLIQHAQVQGAQTDTGVSEWSYAAPGFETAWGFWRSPVQLRERWIEVGALWTNRSVCYFVDGQKTGCERYRWVTNTGESANAAELIMQLAVGGPWAGRNGVDAAAFPTVFEVDHVRVYRKEGD